MTERKPPGIGFETWVERQIREATERGEFDNLPGAGKPIEDLDKSHDELWWVKQKLRRERLSYLPPTIALRKEAEDALVAASQAGSAAEVRRIVRACHERYDGTGYPDQLAGESIPIESRIIFACDAFHAMTTDRPYRRALSVDFARAQLEEGAGTQFDPEIVAICLRLFDEVWV